MNLNQRLINELKKVTQNYINYIDVKAGLMAPHVIYKGISSPILKASLKDSFMEICRDAEIAQKDYRLLLIDYLENRYNIPPLLEEYKNNFILTIQYICSPSPEDEEHISQSIIQRQEEKAQNLFKNFIKR